MQKIIYILLYFISIQVVYSQTFVNGDLEEVYAAISAAPPGWQMVPETDVNCQATTWAQATPDIYSITGPWDLFGMYGEPYSGSTFVGGAYGYSIMNDIFFQEGIMQSVSGFEVDSLYTVGFFQTVRIRNSCYDPSGSWMLIVDDSVIGISTPSVTNVGEFNLNLVWEKREFVFKAWNSTHVIKFLPIDNDTGYSTIEYGELGAICMGIDSVYVDKYTCDKKIELGPDQLFCEGDSTILNGYQVNSSFEWNTGETDFQLVVKESGAYILEVTSFNCPNIDSLVNLDTVNITVVPYPKFDLGDEFQYKCKFEDLVLNINLDNTTYIWQDNSTNSSFVVSDTGQYYVEADRLGCAWTDTVRVLNKFCDGILEMPNVITPNNDNQNDFYNPLVSLGIKKIEFVILNRWGQVIYSTNETNFSWDGKNLDGDLVSEGVYFWNADYIDINNKLNQLSGTVTVLK